MRTYKKFLPDVVVVLVFAIISFAYFLVPVTQGKILFQGNPDELASNKIVREKYLSNSFVLRKKDFQLIDEERRARESDEGK